MSSSSSAAGLNTTRVRNYQVKLTLLENYWIYQNNYLIIILSNPAPLPEVVGQAGRVVVREQAQAVRQADGRHDLHALHHVGADVRTRLFLVRWRLQ